MQLSIMWFSNYSQTCLWSAVGWPQICPQDLLEWLRIHFLTPSMDGIDPACISGRLICLRRPCIKDLDIRYFAEGQYALSWYHMTPAPLQLLFALKSTDCIPKS